MKRIFFTVCAVLALIFATPMVTSAQRRNPPSGGGGGGQTATPRSGGSSGGGQTTSTPPSGGGAVQRGGSGGSVQAPSGGAVRRGGGGAVYGQAVPRGSVPGSRIVVPYRYYGVSPWYYYSPYAYGAFGLGYWGWDPYWWGGYPGSWGYPYGYGGYYGGGYYGGGYYGGGGGYYDRNREYRDYGSVRLKVKPKEAEVYVDGYYMGQVDDFDGTFQHLDIEAGAHRIEVRANGYQPLVFELRVAPGRTVNYEGRLRPGGTAR